MFNQNKIRNGHIHTFTQDSKEYSVACFRGTFGWYIDGIKVQENKSFKVIEKTYNEVKQN